MRVAYAWVIIAVGALMTCVAIGAMFSLAVFLEPMSTATGWSRADTPGGLMSAPTAETRLARETSPYLLQHTDNPVHWWACACLVRMTEILCEPILLTTDPDFRIYRRLGRRTVPWVPPD